MDFSADFRSNRGPIRKGSSSISSSSSSLKSSIINSSTNNENISSNIDHVTSSSSASSSSASLSLSKNNSNISKNNNSINNDINNDTITIINDNDVNIDWITNQLDSLGYSSSSFSSSLSLLSSPDDILLTIIHRLLKTTSSINQYIDDNNKKQQYINTLLKNRDNDANTIEQLRNDTTNSNNRIAMMSIEHREVKAHWLQEKSQLESRLFQMQALKTQLDAKHIKQEQDYQKLQTQLSKLVKESNRGSKHSVITITTPLQKNLSQSKAPTTLVSAELVSANQKIAHLEQDNNQLRRAVDRLRSDIEEVKQSFEENIAIIANERLEALQQVDQLRTQIEEIESNGTAIASPMPVSASEVEAKLILTESIKKTRRYSIGTPLRTPGSVVKHYLDEGEESARPYNWIIEQANSEVKQLRNRADCLKQTNDSDALKAQLIEAISVIHEQDKLIHAALLGKLPGFEAKIEHQVDYNPNEDEEQEERNEREHREDVPRSILSDIANEDDVFPNVDTFDESLFPPASPATLELVKGLWNCTTSSKGSSKYNK